MLRTAPVVALALVGVALVCAVIATSTPFSSEEEELCGGVTCGTISIVPQAPVQTVVYQQPAPIVFQQAAAPAPVPISFNAKAVDSDAAARKSFRLARKAERRSKRVEREIKSSQRRQIERIKHLQEYFSDTIKEEKRRFAKRFWEMKESMVKKIRDAKTVVGPQGPQGKRGVRGPRGATGPTGTMGPTGPTGFVGVQGPRGKPGKPGHRGKQGVTGDRGAPGPKGKDGIAGDTGKKGPTGPAGPKGKVGKRGYAGDTKEAKCASIGGKWINDYCFKSSQLDGNGDKNPENCNVEPAPAAGWKQAQFTQLCKAFRTEGATGCETPGDSTDAGNCADNNVFAAFEQGTKPNVYVHSKSFDWNPTANDAQGACHLKQGMVAVYVCKI